MAEDLEHIIERIKSRGVQEAEKQSEEIVSAARKQAAEMIDEARERSERIVSEAEERTASIEKRSRAAMDQAARDLLLTVEEAVENIFEDLIHESVDRTMDEEFLKEVLSRALNRCFSEMDSENVELQLSEKDGSKLVEYLSARYRDKLDEGLQLRTDSEVLKGFRISFKDRHVYLDYTSRAVAEALANFLRPRLAEIVICAAEVRDGVAEACREIGERRRNRAGSDEEQGG